MEDDDVQMKSNIEKIKLKELKNEAKLREKYAIESTIATLKRNLNETETRVAKLAEELIEINKRIDLSRSELMMAHTAGSSLAAQILASEKELQHLKLEMELGISRAWEQRNVLCQEVQKVSDQCDVWALFSKPKFIDVPKPKKPVKEHANEINHEEILAKARKRKQSLIEERDRLLAEPENGEEFKRIKNALRYSIEMAAQNSAKCKNL